MGRIYNAEDIATLFKEPHVAENWTAIVPAAGRGSRLHYGLPKVLFPIAGKPILGYLAQLLKERVKKTVFICSPDGISAIDECAKRYLGSYECVIQPEPKGMADALFFSESAIQTPFCLVIWGDQILIKPETLDAAMKAHEYRPNAAATVPTLLKNDPYIHFERDSEMRITRVLQRREGEIHQEVGENDGGTFLFNAIKLFSVLHRERSNSVAYGSITREYNLLPLLPSFEEEGEGLCTLRILSEEETLGINTVSEAETAERVIRNRIRGTNE